MQEISTAQGPPHEETSLSSLDLPCELMTIGILLNPRVLKTSTSVGP